MILLNEFIGLWPYCHLYVNIYCKIKGIISLLNEVKLLFYIGR